MHLATPSSMFKVKVSCDQWGRFGKGSRVMVAPHFPFRRTIPFLLLYFRLALCCYSLARHNHLTVRLRAPLMAFWPGDSQFSRSFHFPHDQPHRTVCPTHLGAAMSNAVWVIYDSIFQPLCRSVCSLFLLNY